ncbi:MAG TPA: hypothetical protein VMS17_18475 [Gemmataceae bacterium]|nr:hypothetical protein [Gemmataceae bacterium]
MNLGALTWACLLLSAAALPPDVQPINQRTFQLPINFDPQTRAQIRDLQLWVSHDKGQTWNLAQTAKPEQERFDYSVPEDGSYWFTMLIVDKSGRSDPPDAYHAERIQKLLVDTTPPQIDLTATRQGEQVQVHWNLKEANPKTDTLKLEYADSTEGPWTAVPIKAGWAGDAAFPYPSAVVVRMQLRDAADNLGQAVKQVAAANGGPTLTAAPPAPPSFDGSSVPPLPAPAAPPSSVSPAAATKGADHSTEISHLPPPSGPSPILPPPDGPPALPAPPAPPSLPAAVAPKSTGNQVVAYSSGSVLAGPDGGALRGEMPSLQIVNKREVKLDFEVGKFGPSGLGGVDVYMTTDDGANWQPMTVDPHAVSLPAADARIGPSVRGSVTVPLMNEGVTYGFFVVVKSKAGLGRPAPRPSEPPQVRVELDMTPPKATLVRLEANPTRPDTLTLIWVAEDKHLTATPVTLEWSASAGPDAQWNPIGPPELENKGRYDWQPGPEVPPNVYLRMTVRDTAGNRAVAQSKGPQLIDLNVPEVTNIGLSGQH